MKITAITRFKHGELYGILKRLGWSQKDLARKCGINQSTIGTIINLIRRPSVEQANAIQRALGEAGEYLDVLAEWPETFAGLKRAYRVEQTKEIPMERLLDHPEVLQIAAPDPEVDENHEFYERLEAAINRLPETPAKVIRERFYNGKTFKEIGEELGFSDRGIWQIEQRALHFLRTPYYDNPIRPFLTGERDE